MAGKKIKNPLLKRVPREFIGDWKKYIVVTIFLVTMIGVTAGMYVANNSMVAAFDTMEDDFILEDGHFELNKQASPELIAAIESGEMADIRGYYESQPYYMFAQDEIEDEISRAEEKYGLNDPDFVPVNVEVYENFYLNLDEDSESHIRVFSMQNAIDLPCIHSGRLPASDSEIAIDRMHADNADIEIGQTITIGGQDYEVVGLISLANYTTLHESNSDTMFNALTFDVGLVTEDGFARVSENNNIHYMYSWLYGLDPSDEIEEKDASERFLKALITQVAITDNEIEDYLPSYLNQAITFAPDDIIDDMTMVGILLYVFIGIIAFIFAVTLSTTIVKESSVIGTLRASGYTKDELIAHYMAMPVVVTLVSSVIGNLLGYTLCKDVVKNLYYNSYSLPVYKTLWNGDAFLKTTIIPLAIVLLVNYVVIAYSMRLSPLKFLRHDLKTGKKKNVINLPSWKFLSRFRVRILLQNGSNYLILAFGVIFVMFLMTFSYAMPDTLDHIVDETPKMLFADYQVILKDTVDEEGNLITTNNSDAEKFAINGLIYKSDVLDEEVSVYGFVEDSRYFSLPVLGESEIVLSDSMADKYNFSVGDVITLNEKYENVSYEFTVVQIRKSSSMAIFMGIDAFNSTFDMDEDYFAGFLSSSEITDIADKNIAKVITIEDALMQANQLNHSMGSMMEYLGYACIVMAAVLIYLLTKIIIEKNENAISMTKILGYKPQEIASLYLMSTTWVMIVVELVAVFVGRAIMGIVWRIFLYSMPGWFPFYMDTMSLVKIFMFVFLAFILIMLLDYRRIRKIPMDEALKHVE